MVQYPLLWTEPEEMEAVYQRDAHIPVISAALFRISTSQRCWRMILRHHLVPESRSCCLLSIFQKIHPTVCLLHSNSSLKLCQRWLYWLPLSLMSKNTWQHSLRRDVSWLLVWGTVYHSREVMEAGTWGQEAEKGWVMILNFLSPWYSGCDSSLWNHITYIQDRPSHLS